MVQSKLSEQHRTVVFTDEEALSISNIIRSFNPEDATEALEEVAQNLFRNVTDLDTDIGGYYFILRQLSGFHTQLFERLKPLGKAYFAAENHQ